MKEASTARTALLVGLEELGRQRESREPAEHGAALGHLGNGAELSNPENNELDGGRVPIRSRYSPPPPTRTAS
jgi:hypothetical protein